MGFFTRILYGLTEFVRRNPVTCLVILILAVAAPSVLVGIANFIFYVMLTILLLGVVFVLLFRYRVNKLRREMGQQGGFSQEGPRRRTYTWYSRRDEGDVKVYKTSDTPEKRINDSVGEYVEFEEVEEPEPEKINLRRPNAVRSPGIDCYVVETLRPRRAIFHPDGKGLLAS